jgi:hypothetical protein
LECQSRLEKEFQAPREEAAVAKRFFNDSWFRSNMLDKGSGEFTISKIDDGALEEKSSTKTG